MARQIQRISARKAATLTKAGRHSDGSGLYLNVTESGAKSWVFMWKVAGKRREIRLGPLRDVPLGRARELAAEARQHILEGRDPVASREKPKAMPFGEAADTLIESMAPSWRNEKHKAQGCMTLRVYCEPMRGKPVSGVTTEDVLRVLRPL